MTTDVFMHATTAERAALIEARLTAALAPVASIQITDDSAQHAGHAGASAGGHFQCHDRGRRVCRKAPRSTASHGV